MHLHIIYTFVRETYAMEKILLSEKHKQLLFQIPLLRELEQDAKLSILDKLDYSVYSVEKKDVIVHQGVPCKKLYILLEGKLRVDIIDGLGNKVMIENIIAPRAFATPHLFGTDTTLPATFTAMEHCTLFTATKESTFNLISQNPKVLHNFLCITGNCNVCTVSRLKILSRKTVRERFAVYLFENKGNRSRIIPIAHTQSELAEYLNVTRPALSKEINKMTKERIIQMTGKSIEVLNEAALKGYVG